MGSKRVSFSVPEESVEALSYVSRRLGVSRSALVSQMLAEALPVMVDMLQSVPEQGFSSESEAKRFRGDSAEIIRARLDNLNSMATDLFAQPSGQGGGDD